MHIEEIKLKNFKAFKDVRIKKIPKMAVFVGANGTGKSTLFSVFSFLKSAYSDNVTMALKRLGGNRGFQEVKSRDSKGPIEIEIKFREKENSPLITYTLLIDEENGDAIILQETLKYRRGSKGKPWNFIDFRKGEGEAVINEPDQVKNESELKRDKQKLKSPDILAIKGLSQFEKFPASKAFGDLLENWNISDFQVNLARQEVELNYAQRLSSQGDNLANVSEFLFKKRKEVFNAVLSKLSQRVNGISNVESKITEDGRVLLRFTDGEFKDPFLAKHVSDGTIRMFAYLILLHDPNPSPLLCVEEPENQLYHSLLDGLIEEFRDYALRGGQVFISTHSPDLLNSCNIDEVFFLQKKKGFTTVFPVKNSKQIKDYVEQGDKLGWLWREGFLDELPKNN